MTVITSKKSFLETKLQGLRQRCKKETKIRFIMEVEKLWEKYAMATYSFDLDPNESLTHLLDQLAFTITNKVIWATNRWSNKRISSADFESEFIEEVWRLCENYKPYNTFYFYETIQLIWIRREIDVVRKATSKQTPLLLKNENIFRDTTDVEKEVTDRLFVERMISDRSLDPIEAQLLSVIYEHPDSSNRHIARLMGFADHKRVDRMLKRLTIKLARYKDIFLYDH